MALTQDQWLAKLKKFVPSWNFEVPSGLNLARFTGIAALFAQFDADALDHFNATFLTRSTSPILDDMGDERSVERNSGESDASYASRIQIIANSTNLASLQAAVDGCLNNDSALFILNEQNGYADVGGFFCDDYDSRITSRTKNYNFFTVIIPPQTAGDLSVIFAAVISVLEKNKAFGVSYDVLYEGDYLAAEDGTILTTEDGIPFTT